MQSMNRRGVHTICLLRIVFDPARNERNIRERRIPFDLAAKFLFDQAIVFVDRRRDYGEVRYVALGPIEGRLHVMCFTETEDGIRVVGLRKANHRAVTRHAKLKETD